MSTENTAAPEAALDLEAIRARHDEDAPNMPDLFRSPEAACAHRQRGELIAEVERLRAALTSATAPNEPVEWSAQTRFWRSVAALMSKRLYYAYPDHRERHEAAAAIASEVEALTDRLRAPSQGSPGERRIDGWASYIMADGPFGYEWSLRAEQVFGTDLPASLILRAAEPSRTGET